jgi:hypothetical protein
MVQCKMKKYAEAMEMFDSTLRLNPGYEPAKIFLESARAKIHR